MINVHRYATLSFDSAGEKESDVISSKRKDRFVKVFSNEIKSARNSSK